MHRFMLSTRAEWSPGGAELQALRGHASYFENRASLSLLDDFLVLFQCARGDLEEQVQRITNTFETTLAGLTLRWELPSDSGLRFLYLILHFRPSYVCSRYSHRLRKRHVCGERHVPARVSPFWNPFWRESGEHMKAAGPA